MQKFQRLIQSSRLSKHAIKHIGNIDDKNCTIVFTDNTQGRTFMIQSTFLYNDKVTYEKINEEKEIKRKIKVIPRMLHVSYGNVASFSKIS